MTDISIETGVYTTPGATVGLTVGDVVGRIQNVVYGAHWPALDKLAEDLDTSETDVTLTYSADNVKAGGWLCVDYEDMRSWTNPSANVVTVERGMRGSVAATHTNGALVEVNPRFSKFRILEEIKDEIRSWPRGIYAVATVELDAGSSDDALDLGSPSGVNVLRLLRASRSPSSSVETWPRVDARLATRADTTDFPSGYAVEFSPLGEAATIRVAYAFDFDLDSFDPAIDLSVLGMSDNQADIVQWGAAWRLLASDEANRSADLAQHRSRRAEEVPPSARLRPAAFYKQMRDDRLKDEQARLLSEFGWGYRSK